MYVLKRLRPLPDGRSVEESFVLGDFYRLEFHSKDTCQGVVAQVEYARDGDMPCIEIEGCEEAYITTLTGDTVRVICRGTHVSK